MSACVAPPSDLNVCSLPGNARIPQEFSNTNADRQLEAYFNFLENIKATPTRKCAEAYIEFACSEAYPRCNGDANSGLGYAVNTCYQQCSNFIEECRGQLVGVDRPDCGHYSVSSDCSGRKIKIDSSSSTLSAGLMFITFMAALVAAL
eukprot:CAMPEP_0206194478 /NCGR_PEP_ID=MMETSP0166-20121206/7222_1 /ASSEMBLY_ACC=CAM_ASM_000260 /TAXON_ID=95228 /ORGANISM="Vannella robusta, Strain DIVA3 518/3/11/1/6" /LENGTH=147 /DNA_ID=CAMNT_0053611461 /DNA_START=399 /DNA_END=842 /DNA_ORIENTATION=+